MQSRGQPELFKVGFTKRKTVTRRQELNRVAGDDLKIVMAISMPWARKCEALALKRLRRNPFRKRDRRGTEWFWLRPGESIDDISRRIHKSSERIEFVASWKLSWPKQMRKRVFQANGLFTG